MCFFVCGRHTPTEEVTQNPGSTKLTKDLQGGHRTGGKEPLATACSRARRLQNQMDFCFFYIDKKQTLIFSVSKILWYILDKKMFLKTIPVRLAQGYRILGCWGSPPREQSKGTGVEPYVLLPVRTLTFCFALSLVSARPTLGKPDYVATRRCFSPARSKGATLRFLVGQNPQPCVRPEVGKTLRQVVLPITWRISSKLLFRRFFN
jgi:hypothetical protein